MVAFCSVVQGDIEQLTFCSSSCNYFAQDASHLSEIVNFFFQSFSLFS